MAGHAESFAEPIREGWCGCYEDPDFSGDVVWLPMVGEPEVIKEKNQLISELADALEMYANFSQAKLLQRRAREAAK